MQPQNLVKFQSTLEQMPRLPRKCQVKIGDKVFELYSIGFLHSSTGKSVRMLRHYEATHVLPRPLVKHPSGVRWYLAEEILRYGQLFRAYAPSQGNRKDLSPQHIHRFRDILAAEKDKLRLSLKRNIAALEVALKDDDFVPHLTKLRVKSKMRRLLSHKLVKTAAP